MVQSKIVTTCSFDWGDPLGYFKEKPCNFFHCPKHTCPHPPLNQFERDVPSQYIPLWKGYIIVGSRVRIVPCDECTIYVSMFWVTCWKQNYEVSLQPLTSQTLNFAVFLFLYMLYTKQCCHHGGQHYAPRTSTYTCIWHTAGLQPLWHRRSCGKPCCSLRQDSTGYRLRNNEHVYR